MGIFSFLFGKKPKQRRPRGVVNQAGKDMKKASRLLKRLSRPSRKGKRGLKY